MQAIIFITGKGLHSADGPKVKPAIAKLVETYNLRCTEGRPNAGCLYVELVTASERGFCSGLGCVIC